MTFTNEDFKLLKEEWEKALIYLKAYQRRGDFAKHDSYCLGLPCECGFTAADQNLEKIKKTLKDK